MRKPGFCICENGADQLCGRKADQCLCFSDIDNIDPVLPKSEISRL